MFFRLISGRFFITNSPLIVCLYKFYLNYSLEKKRRRRRSKQLNSFLFHYRNSFHGDWILVFRLARNSNCVNFVFFSFFNSLPKEQKAIPNSIRTFSYLFWKQIIHADTYKMTHYNGINERRQHLIEFILVFGIRHSAFGSTKTTINDKPENEEN